MIIPSSEKKNYLDRISSPEFFLSTTQILNSHVPDKTRFHNLRRARNHDVLIDAFGRLALKLER